MKGKQTEKLPNLVWIDLETTGLDPGKEVILEIAIHITDSDLNVLDEGYHEVIHQPQDVLNKMDDWCTEHHGKSGLTKEVQNSKNALPQIEDKALEYINKYSPEKSSPLCGNSIWFDRMFLKAHMPTLENYLHYHVIDVSSVKVLALRWFPNLPKFQKRDAHRALDDIEDSINELKYLRKHVFAVNKNHDPTPA